MARWYNRRRTIDGTVYVSIPVYFAMQYRIQRDKEMAAYLKAIDHTRDSARCPVCYDIVALRHLMFHLSSHISPPA